MNKIKTTQEYYDMTIDELLVTREYGTREECNLIYEGLEVVYYDNVEEMEEDKDNLTVYINGKHYEIKVVLKTINERIAVILA